MPEAFGDGVRRISRRIGEVAKKAWKEIESEGGIFPERPQRVLSAAITEQVIAVRYLRWIKFPDSFRVGPPDRWVPFGMDKLLEALGYEGADGEETLAARARANLRLNEMERKGLIFRGQGRDPTTGERYNIFHIQDRDALLRLAQSETDGQKDE